MRKRPAVRPQPALDLRTAAVASVSDAAGRSLPESASPGGASDRLPVHLDGEIRLLPLGDILYCYADGDRTMVVTRQGELRTRLSLDRLTTRLEPHRFFRCHRAYLVNLTHVRSVIPWTRNAYTLALDGGRDVPLSKHRLHALKDLLGL
ncbi:MAG: LytTR family DNA-binding domain-containing protein [Armatimonadota bacterium]|nr:LytTR family DNA-binding domain-containing protein [Armatimonadota bacterium]MDR7402551.1 LytTR family DNA-binding domain-containing protein [Armatimonadota bacterium]MDR7403850.1 LytTR family DNA-binding domain-containing protein [Armatimonadota bacterium]MDR7436065.1 LytTR family DNA-binding domain-containing protein [Armatimonadota bacterium]MDR7471944.1 LytTR family DNA-binding domain-containing protein [Armatimonadota bacterium]